MLNSDKEAWLREARRSEKYDSIAEDYKKLQSSMDVLRQTLESMSFVGDQGKRLSLHDIFD